MKKYFRVAAALVTIFTAMVWFAHGQGVTQQAMTPSVLASFNAPAQQANVPSTLTYTTTLAGSYRASCYVEVTQAATTSSTMPNCVVGWTTADSSSAQTANITSTSTSNTVGTNSASAAGTAGFDIIQVAKGANINVSTAGYTSVGATPMQYAVHFKLETMGQ